jgi:hypothetical protein
MRMSGFSGLIFTISAVKKQLLFGGTVVALTCAGAPAWRLIPGQTVKNKPAGVKKPRPVRYQLPAFISMMAFYDCSC